MFERELDWPLDEIDGGAARIVGVPLVRRRIWKKARMASASCA